jgi:hypothetical protein
VSLRIYDDFGKAGYSLTDYTEKWMTPNGLGEMAVEDTRRFSGGRLHVSAVPFRAGSDVGVDDHRKYLAVSTRTFPVPRDGTLVLSARQPCRATATAGTDGTDGTYTIAIAAADVGTGARTVLTQIAAGALGVGLDRVNLQIGDSGEIGIAATATAAIANAVHHATGIRVRDLPICMDRLINATQASTSREKGDLQ